jgi:hypothetical protein
MRYHHHLLDLFAARLAAQAGGYTELFKDLYDSPYSGVPDRAKYPRLRAAGRTRKIIDAGLEPCASRDFEYMYIEYNLNNIRKP